MRPRGVGVAVAGLLVVVVLLVTCGENGPSGEGDAGTNTKCAKGLKPMGPACVPIFDECLDDEVPMLGGGCKRVGVKECNGGWGIAGPPDWKCKPIGPPQKCLKGWAKVKGGWCEPILPKTKCPVGTMEKIGHTTCQPIGDCGSGTWGKTKPSANAIYVNQGYEGKNCDGTQAKPFTTIGAALSAAKAGDRIVVASGKYKEDLNISKTVTLEGVCPEKVSIQNVSGTSLLINAKAVVVSGVSIYGSSTCVKVNQFKASLKNVAIHGCGEIGVVATENSDLYLQDCLVANNGTYGIMLGGAKAVLERTVVRDSQPRHDGLRGFGIQAVLSTDNGKAPSTLILRESIVSNNRTVGIMLWGSTATLDRSVVKDTQARSKDNQKGMGLQAMRYYKVPASITSTDSLIAGNRMVGIDVVGSAATLNRNVIRDTKRQLSNGRSGMGIQCQVHVDTPAKLKMTDCLVANNRADGVLLYGSDAVLDRSVIRDTKSRYSDRSLGIGVKVARRNGRSSVLSMQDCVVANNRDNGVLLWGSSGTFERSVIRGTSPQESDQKSGMGIYAGPQSLLDTKPSSLTMKGCLVTNNTAFGVKILGTNATLESTIIMATQPSPGGELGAGISLHSFGKTRSSLTTRECIVTGNHVYGIYLQNSKATIDRTVARDTQAQASNGREGVGISAQIETGGNMPSELTVRDSLVMGNRTTGITVFSSTATVERSVVSNTLRQESDHRFGLGILGKIWPGHTLPSKVTIIDSLISRNRTVGFGVIGSSGRLVRCAILNTMKDDYGRFGDGVSTNNGASLDVRGSLVDHNERVGILYEASGGTVNGSLIRSNVFAIALERGANPTIGNDNQLIDNEVNKVTTGRGLKAAPMPTVPDPLGSDAGTKKGPDAGVGTP